MFYPEVNFLFLEKIEPKYHYSKIRTENWGLRSKHFFETNLVCHELCPNNPFMKCFLGRKIISSPKRTFRDKFFFITKEVASFKWHCKLSNGQWLWVWYHSKPFEGPFSRTFDTILYHYNNRKNMLHTVHNALQHFKS